MRVFGYMVTRNEADRYLQAVLHAAMPHLDGLAVYDDQSTDATAERAKAMGAHVRVRPDGVPSFLDHEGQFRQCAWSWFEMALEPRRGDWVLAFDADEFLVRGAVIRSLVSSAALEGCGAIDIPLPEVWAVQPDGAPLIREDGMWNDLSAPRLFAWQSDGTFRGVVAEQGVPDDGQIGSGSVPLYAEDQPLWTEGAPALLHYGYLDPADRVQKMARYSGSRSHRINLTHIASIAGRPTLGPWAGPYPAVWRGIR